MKPDFLKRQFILNLKSEIIKNKDNFVSNSWTISLEHTKFPLIKISMAISLFYVSHDKVETPFLDETIRNEKFSIIAKHYLKTNFNMEDIFNKFKENGQLDGSKNYYFALTTTKVPFIITDKFILFDLPGIEEEMRIYESENWIFLNR